MEFRILFLRNSELLEKDITLPYSSIPDRYLNDVYNDFKESCHKIGVQLICMVPIINGIPNTNCFIANSFRYYFGFDLNEWLSWVFPDETIVFKGDKFDRFSKRRKK